MNPLPQNLTELARQLENVLDLYQQGQIALIEKNLMDFFSSLQSFINPSDLSRCVSIMSNATYLLEKKLDLLKSFFITLSMKQNLTNFFASYSTSEQDYICLDVLHKVLSFPFSLPEWSMKNIQNTWTRLIDRKIVSYLKEIKQDDLDSQIDTPLIENTITYTPPFEEEMIKYLRRIYLRLPNTLDTLLATDTDISTYFTHFLYLLHLVQQGYLVYNSESKQFSRSSKTHE